MPKQLKIIVDENYTPNAPFTVNFAAPIIIEPGNKIALDKFTSVINGITSGFTLPNSTFTFYYSLNSPNFASSTVNILGQRYDNILQLLNNLTTGCNNTFTAYQTGYLPQTIPPTIYRDIGLKVLCSAATNTATATTNTFQIQYATSPLSALNMNSADLTAGIGGFAYPTTTDWNIVQVDENTPILQGGGCLVRFQIQIPTEAEALANGSTWDIGLIDTVGSYHGLYQDEIGGLFLENGTSLTEIPLENFPKSVVGGDQYYCEIYQVGGQFALRYYLLLGDDSQTELYNSNTSHPGALGTFSCTENYIFQAEGTLDDAANQFPAINVGGILMTSDIAMTVNTPSAVNRTVAFDMSAAGSLRAGLDVPGGLNVLTPINSPFGGFLCQASINMAIVNSSFDIAIEILDLPLQTYQASTSRKPGQRNNVVAYFHPEFSQVGTGTYIYDSRSYQWLDIDITYPINLSSLSFRVYDPDTGTGLDALSMSFNLLISTEQY